MSTNTAIFSEKIVESTGKIYLQRSGGSSTSLFPYMHTVVNDIYRIGGGGPDVSDTLIKRIVKDTGIRYYAFAKIDGNKTRDLTNDEKSNLQSLGFNTSMSKSEDLSYLIQSEIPRFPQLENLVVNTSKNKENFYVIPYKIPKNYNWDRFFKKKSFVAKLTIAVYTSGEREISYIIKKFIKYHFLVVCCSDKNTFRYYRWSFDKNLWYRDEISFIVISHYIVDVACFLCDNFLIYLQQQDEQNDQIKHKNLIKAAAVLRRSLSRSGFSSTFVTAVCKHISVAKSKMKMDLKMDPKLDIWIPTNDDKLHNILTGESRLRTREDYCSYTINAKFLTDEELNPADVEFVNSFFNRFTSVEGEPEPIEGDDHRYDERNYLYQTFGAYLACVRHKTITILKGPSNSGKSVVLNILLHLAGDSGVVADNSVVLAKQAQATHSANIIPLIGKRLCVFAELPDKAFLNAAFLKKMTGDDSHALRDAGATSEKVINTKLPCGIIMNSNVPIHPESFDEAIMERLRIVNAKSRFINGITEARRYEGVSHEGETFHGWEYPKDIRIQDKMLEQKHLDTLFTLICKETRKYPIQLLEPPTSITLATRKMVAETLPYKTIIDRLFDYDINVKTPTVLRNKNNVIAVQDVFDICRLESGSGIADDISRFGRNMGPWLKICIIRKEVKLRNGKHPQCYVGFTPKDENVVNVLTNIQNSRKLPNLT